MDEAGAWTARAAIAELITRYAALNDAGDWDAVAALYTEEGRMSRPTAPDEFITGRAAILAAFRSRPRRASRHILLFVGSVAGDGGLPIQSADPPLIGSYADTLVKTQEGWRFAERRGSLDFRAQGMKRV